MNYYILFKVQKGIIMEKVLIFGTGSTGQRIYREVKNSVEVLGFLDNDSSKWGNMAKMNYR